jgi:hypothetical protein
MKIEIRNFSGIVPRLAPELLPDNVGQTAQNMSVKSGKIHPEKPFVIEAPDRDYVPGQINEDTYRRLYFLDTDGAICVCGTFPGGNGSLTSRKVGISAPGEPRLTAISSPFTDAFSKVGNATVTANSGSAYSPDTQWKSEIGKATHIYSQYTLTPLGEWAQMEDGSYERVYQYNPWDTTIFYPLEVTGSGGATVNIRIYDKDSKWKCPCLLSFNGGTFSFDTRKSGDSNAVKGKLLNYNGEEVGTYSAYNEKISADTYPEMSIPAGATLNDANAKCYYFNDRAYLDGNEIKLGDGNQIEEQIAAGNLKFTISRSYTDITRDAYYVIRAVNDICEEGEPSELSAMITRQPDERVTLTFTASENAANEKITAYRLYRSAGGTDGSNFLFAAEIKAAGALEFQDDLRDELLNEVMPSFGAVPEDIDGIAGMSGGFMVAYKGKDIYFSEPYRYYCFPWDYNQSVPFDIVGIAVRGDYLYVMTTGPLYAFVGNSPQTIAPLCLRFDVPCISRKSIAHVGGKIIYAGTTGLVMIDNSGPRVFSDALYTIEQYKDLHFENCISAGEYDGKYFAVIGNQVLLFDFADESLHHTTLDSSAFTLGSYDWNDGSWLNYRENFSDTNTPYGETMITQNFAGTALTGSWQSKDYIFPRPVAFTCARVRFSGVGTDVDIKLFAEGKEVFAGKVQHNNAFRLPVMRRECRWSVQVSGVTDITSVELSESMMEL